MIVVLDIDGVISDHKWRYKYTNYDWEMYHSLSSQDNSIKDALPGFVQYARSNFIFFLTGRPEHTRTSTEIWLIKNLFFPYKRLIMRSDFDKTPTARYKEKQLIKIGVNKINLFIDDDVRNRNVAIGLGVKTRKSII